MVENFGPYFPVMFKIKFVQLIVRKIIKIVATMCQIYGARLNYPQGSEKRKGVGCNVMAPTFFSPKLH